MTKKKEMPSSEPAEAQNTERLTSLEEAILQMRYGLLKNTEPGERKISQELQKKLQFLELKAFEASGRIDELVAELESSGPKNKK